MVLVGIDSNCHCQPPHLQENSERAKEEHQGVKEQISTQQQQIADGAREVKELDNQIMQLQQIRDNVSTYHNHSETL